MKEARPSQPTEVVNVRLVSDVLTRLQKQAGLRGLCSAEVINHALELWVTLSEKGAVECDQKVYVCFEQGQVWWRRLLLKLFGVRSAKKRMVVRMAVTLPAETVENTLLPGRLRIEG